MSLLGLKGVKCKFITASTTLTLGRLANNIQAFIQLNYRTAIKIDANLVFSLAVLLTSWPRRSIVFLAISQLLVEKADWMK